MQNVIAPTFSMPLGAAPGGSIVEPGIEIAGTPPSVFVAEAVWNESWWQWFWWHFPTFVIVACVVAGIPLGLKILRIARVRQEVGKWYCRRCNHLLDVPHVRVEEKHAAWTDDQAKCPECGDHAANGPVAGRLLLPRIAKYAVPMWLLVSLVMFQVPSNLGWRKASWRGPSGTWPIDGLEPVFGPWAIQRQKSLDSAQGWRYWKVDPISHAATLLATVASSRATEREFVSPDGQFIVTPSGSANTLLVIDAHTKDTRTVQLGSRISLGLSSLHVLGYSDDGRTAFVERSTLYGPSDELFGIELASGKSNVIAVASRVGSSVGAGSHSFGTFVVEMGAEQPVWVYTESISHFPQRESQKYVRWTRSGRAFEKYIETDGDTSIVRVLAQADAVSIEPRNGKTKFYSLETGEEIERPKPAAAASRPRLPLRVLRDLKVGAATVEDANGKALGTMQYSINPGAYPKRSEDRRFFVATGSRNVDGPLARWFRGVPQIAAPEVRVWDLSIFVPPSASSSNASDDPAGEKSSPDRSQTPK